MKSTIGILAVLIIGIIAFVIWSPQSAPTSTTENTVAGNEEVQMNDTETMTAERSVFIGGGYIIRPEMSTFNWAGQKPLIEGYVNSGSIAVTDGSIFVSEDSVIGDFTIDMNTLSVNATPAKPGKESALEGHLKGAGWFNVEEYPEARFVITSVTPQADSETTFLYDVTGELTMKGITGTLEFPATIYLDSDWFLHASANLEFDRTEWDITAGSGSFFDNLADNVVDDMVALSFELVAEKQ